MSSASPSSTDNGRSWDPNDKNSIIDVGSWWIYVLLIGIIFFLMAVSLFVLCRGRDRRRRALAALEYAALNLEGDDRKPVIWEAWLGGGYVDSRVEKEVDMGLERKRLIEDLSDEVGRREKVGTVEWEVIMPISAQVKALVLDPSYLDIDPVPQALPSETPRHRLVKPLPFRRARTSPAPTPVEHTDLLQSHQTATNLLRVSVLIAMPSPHPVISTTKDVEQLPHLEVGSVETEVVDLGNGLVDIDP
ncbi:hypothetical protein V5O48_007495 [Marasmius crinis-equi]|uniref:Transmembrane protein n=1 Tax=Marasmius crinis-equi TaxID=585013 RepID=A0ABR3FGH6_9AGAR